MKKISLYLSLAFAGLFMTSCDEDFKDWAAPQSNGPEEAITLPGIQASAVAAIDLATVTTDSVVAFSLNTSAFPSDYTLGNARVDFTPVEINHAPTTIYTSLEGATPVEKLRELVESTYGKRPVLRAFTAHVYVNAVKGGQAVLVDCGAIQVMVKPKAPFISSAYYLVGDMVGWDAVPANKFAHSGADVYEDPVFTIQFTTTADNQYWKIIPQSCLDAGGTWAIENAYNGVVGVETNGDTSMSGTLLTTTSTGEKANAGRIEHAGTYLMTINMLDYTYDITVVTP